jgi:hypothetical protein
MTYSEKLRDPRWQKKRLEIMQRDKFTCQLCCDDENTLNVHHHKYINGKDPWDYDNNDLITLCEECHEYESKYRKECEEQLLQWLKNTHYTTCDLERLSHIAYIIKDSETLCLIDDLLCNFDIAELYKQISKNIPFDAISVPNRKLSCYNEETE